MIRSALAAVSTLLAAALPAVAQDKFDLPLRPGYYVDTEVSCAGASNATIMFVSSHGINSARTFCEFTRLDRVSDTELAFEEECGDISGQQAFTYTGLITLLGPDRYRSVNNEDWSYEAAYCPQSAMPEPWRSTELPPDMRD